MKFFKIVFFLLIICQHSKMLAADILPDVNYVIFNAYSKFSGICLQDDKGLGSNNIYNYSFAARDTSELRQEWVFIRDTHDSTMYYIRNAKTKLYLSGEPSEGSKRNFEKACFQTLKSKSIPWKITDIGTTGQIQLSCTNAYGVQYYLHASDTTAAAPNYKNNPLLNKNTRFAWRLELAKDTASITSIKPVTKPSARISVQNRRIIITGAKSYSVYDMRGRQVNPRYSLQPGTYLVKTDGISQKISVK